MSRTATRFITGDILTNANGTLYTVAAGTTLVINKITFANTSVSDRTVDLYLVPMSGVTGALYQLLDTKPVKAHSTLVCYEAEGHVVEEAGFIVAKADTGGAVTILGSGVLIQ